MKAAAERPVSGDESMSRREPGLQCQAGNNFRQTGPVSEALKGRVRHLFAPARAAGGCGRLCAARRYLCRVGCTDRTLRRWNPMLYLDWPTLQTVIVLVLVIVVFVGFVRETMPPDIVALVAVGLLLVTGILGTDEMLSVFSNSAPITVDRKSTRLNSSH